uniref:Uncharacterized protein n=1 Tax=Cannabis sativa TaxID=3483 RepID=A0A803NLD5_CANSA
MVEAAGGSCNACFYGVGCSCPVVQAMLVVIVMEPLYEKFRKQAPPVFLGGGCPGLVGYGGSYDGRDKTQR